jgi:hypothetical protein
MKKLLTVLVSIFPTFVGIMSNVGPAAGFLHMITTIFFVGYASMAESKENKELGNLCLIIHIIGVMATVFYFVKLS